MANPSQTRLSSIAECDPIWVCSDAKHKARVARSEQASTPKRVAIGREAGRDRTRSGSRSDAKRVAIGREAGRELAPNELSLRQSNARLSLVLATPVGV